MTMTRRNLLEMLGAATPLAASTPDAAGTGTDLYAFHRFSLKQGAQLSRFHGFVGGMKLHPGPRIVLQALVADYMPQAATIFAVRSLDEYWSAREDLAGHGGFADCSSALLRATDCSPMIDVATTTKPAIFELRVYRSPSRRQLEQLHNRFAGRRTGIFHRVGIHPLFFSETVLGPDKPSLAYLIPFGTPAARERAWSSFSALPEWASLRQESASRLVQIALFKATE